MPTTALMMPYSTAEQQQQHTNSGIKTKCQALQYGIQYGMLTAAQYCTMQTLANNARPLAVTPTLCKQRNQPIVFLYTNVPDCCSCRRPAAFFSSAASATAAAAAAALPTAVSAAAKAAGTAGPLANGCSDSDAATEFGVAA
jgi:hypothetical protein